MAERCSYCNGRFGLVRHYHAFKVFCSYRSGKRCKERYLAEQAKRFERESKRWLSYLSR